MQAHAGCRPLQDHTEPYKIIKDYAKSVQDYTAYADIVKLQVQGPNLELTLLSHSNKNNNENNNKNNKNPHLNFLREWQSVSGMKPARAMAKL